MWQRWAVNCRKEDETAGCILASAPQRAALGPSHIEECSNNRHLMWLEPRESRFGIAMRSLACQREGRLSGRKCCACNGPSAPRVRVRVAPTAATPHLRSMAFAGLAFCLRLAFPMRIFAMTYLWRTHEASSHAHIMRVV
jgi:hypothetical protein